MNLTDRITEAIEKHAGTADELRQYMYEHPEVAKEEFLSSRAMVRELRAAGYEVEYPYLEKELGYGTAFRAVFKNGKGPRVAILAEYDALQGIGHGCGHNLHGALSILSALAMMELKEEFQGTVYVIGTPAEEDEGAKLLMADLGIFDDMDLAIMMHSNAGASYTNDDALALRCYEIEFMGKSSHAAASHGKGHNALTAARKFLDLVDARRDSFAPGSIFSAIIQEGGLQPNVIPGYARIRTEFRSHTRSGLLELDRIVRNCATGAAIALDCTTKFSYGFADFYDMVRIPVLEEEIRKEFLKRGEEALEPDRASGSTDVGNVSYHCPAIQPLLAITKEKYALHTEELRECTITAFAAEQMEKGASILCEIAMKIFNDEKFREEVRRDFQQALKRKEV